MQSLFPLKISAVLVSVKLYDVINEFGKGTPLDEPRKRIIVSFKRIAVFSSDFLQQALEIVAIHADKLERFLTDERPNVRLADCCLISMSCGVIFILIKSL